METTITLESLYKLVGVAVVIIGFLITLATGYLRLYIGQVMSTSKEGMRKEIKEDYYTRIEAANLARDVDKLLAKC